MDKIKTGIIGCGTISEIYLTNLTKYIHNIEVVCAADLYVEKAIAAAQKYGIAKACTVEELLADEEIVLVANLTVPAAHYELNMQALKAGKHVYCEKPLAMSLQEANEIVSYANAHGLMAASAPDTFLGQGVQTGKYVIDQGRLGNIVSFTANMLSPGPDVWHPNPAFYYKKGAGPLWDMGPYYLTALAVMLGPIEEVFSIASKSGPTRYFPESETEIEVPTTYTGVLKFKSGIIGNVNMSFDGWFSKLPCMEVFGTEGSMDVPDPNMFNGDVLVCSGTQIKEEVAKITGDFNDKLERWLSSTEESTTVFDSPFPQESQPRSNMRGLGLSDMAAAILTGRKSRLSAELSRHIVEVMEAFDISAETKQPYKMTTTFETPDSMPLHAALWAVEE